MKNFFKIYAEKLIKGLFFFVVMFFVLFLTLESYAGYSNGPRQEGEVVLDEVIMGTNKFIIRVGSNGCTDKSSFKVDVKKEEGLSKKSPHYILTIVRVKIDECKAIVDDGTLVLFDLKKDLNLEGYFTYSLTNNIYSSSKIQLSDDSLFSIIEKHFTFKFPQSKEIKP